MQQCDEHGYYELNDITSGCPECEKEKEKEKPEPTKIFIKDSLKTELKALQRQTQRINEQRISLVSGYLMALGHEGYNCSIDATCDFLTLIPKEKKDDAKGPD